MITLTYVLSLKAEYGKFIPDRTTPLYLSADDIIYYYKLTDDTTLVGLKFGSEREVTETPEEIARIIEASRVPMVPWGLHTHTFTKEYPATSWDRQ